MVENKHEITLKAKILRILLAVALAAGSIYLLVKPLHRTIEVEELDLEGMVPDSFKGWTGIPSIASDCQDTKGLLDNRVERVYTNAQKGVSVRLIIEYSSDLRRNFSFNFPEQCLQGKGNRIKVLKPLNVIMPDSRFMRSRCLYIEGAEKALFKKNALVYYWVVMDYKQYARGRPIGIDRLRSWFKKVIKHGFLVRIDYDDDVRKVSESIEEGRRVIEGFVKDMYVSMPLRKSLVMIFGSE